MKKVKSFIKWIWFQIQKIAHLAVKDEHMIQGRDPWATWMPNGQPRRSAIESQSSVKKRNSTHQSTLIYSCLKVFRFLKEMDSRLLRIQGKGLLYLFNLFVSDGAVLKNLRDNMIELCESYKNRGPDSKFAHSEVFKVLSEEGATEARRICLELKKYAVQDQRSCKLRSDFWSSFQKSLNS